jgi:hypothetical protein
MENRPSSPGVAGAPTRRLGVPQLIAALLLTIFFFMGLRIAISGPPTQLEMLYGDPLHWADGDSPLTALVVRAANLPFHNLSDRPLWPERLPFLCFGAALGASLWYVARRLYGNAGGYIALMLFVFSPGVVGYSAQVQPEIAAAWGMFGAIFTAIAVAHTLYAPREVVLWNGRRIVLLGIAVGLGAAAQPFTLVAIPIGLAFMIYLVPERRNAALAIMASGAGIALALLWALVGFRGAMLFAILKHLLAAEHSARLFTSNWAWRMVNETAWQNGPGFILLLLVSLIAFAAWRRTRFFGTLVPVLVAGTLLILSFVVPREFFSNLVLVLPFLFLFIAGVFADLLESRFAAVALGLVLASLAGNAFLCIRALWQMR